jgi:hypothetical protein
LEFGAKTVKLGPDGGHFVLQSRMFTSLACEFGPQSVQLGSYRFEFILVTGGVELNLEIISLFRV